MLGKKTMEAEPLKEAVEIARSQLTARLKQPVPGPPPRRRRTFDDAALVEQIKQAVSVLPSYGYRRVWVCCSAA